MSLHPKKKLIEVALPLPEINDASAYDKMPGIGPHPKGIHHWWARLPLPTARAILFASVVDDPSEHPEKFKTEAAQDAERERLFGIVREMMAKKLHTRPEVYAKARAEMEKYCDGKLPAVLDPFSGGGSIPLEANRLGFEAHAADLNPVAVLLNKCNLELAPRWSGLPPINRDDRDKIGGAQNWRGTTGLAADIRYYAQQLGKEVVKSIGGYYPKATLPKEQGGGEAEIVAWIWARTVRSPNPAARNQHVPLISTFWLSKKKGAATWLEPIVNRESMTFSFEIRTGTPEDKTRVSSGTKLGRGAKFRCLLTDQPLPDKYIKEEALAGRLQNRLLAVVAEAKRGRIYLQPSADQIQASSPQRPENGPTQTLAYNSRYLTPPGYGMNSVSDLFSARQLTALIKFSDGVASLEEVVASQAVRAGLNPDDSSAYAATIKTFLALAVDRCADFNSTLCGWSSTNEKVMHIFGRGAIPMVWDYSEANILGRSVGAWKTCSEYVADCVEVISAGSKQTGIARQIDAATGVEGLKNIVVSTDPPYYDNIPYAAISDFFYVWLRRSLAGNYPELFSTLLVPKMPELTAAPDRFGGDHKKARDHFEDGFRRVFSSLREKMDPRFPLTVYYAFKQEDEEEDVTVESQDGEKGIDLTTGWETLLEALVSSGFQITATWPVSASQKWRMRSMGSNALASYIVLACRPRPASTQQVGRREFLAELKRELPVALKHLQQGNVAPVDFAQASIGPGMAVYSRYSRILESDGKSMTVRTALSLINQIKEQVLGEPESDYDSETRWALTWFDQNGFVAGDFGDANTLANAHAISVSGLQDSGILVSRGGHVRLFSPADLPKDWSPAADQRPTVWEMTHHLVRLFHVQGAGEAATADLLRQLGSRSDAARDLAYRLFSIAERRKRSADAQGYNALVLGWPELARLAQEAPKSPKAADGELNLT